jgi:hypothetical protein
MWTHIRQSNADMGAQPNVRYRGTVSFRSGIAEWPRLARNGPL